MKAMRRQARKEIGSKPTKKFVFVVSVIYCVCFFLEQSIDSKKSERLFWVFVWIFGVNESTNDSS
jgi:hypothetical protein